MTYIQTVVVKPSQVYESYELVKETLETHDVIAFRPPVNGELFVDIIGRVTYAVGSVSNKQPRFIVKRRECSQKVWE